MTDQILAELENENARLKSLNHEAGAIIERLREVQRWIPVTERLPQDENTVEAYSSTFGAFDAYFQNGEWYTRGREIRVTHWRVPEPPKEE